MKNILPNTQIQGIGIHFDHRQECRRAWLYYAMASFAVIFVNVMASLTHDMNTSFESMCVHGFDLIQMVISVMIPTSFIMMLLMLHKRFALLNFLLRFAFYSLNIQSLNIQINTITARSQCEKQPCRHATIPSISLLFYALFFSYFSR